VSMVAALCLTALPIIGNLGRKSSRKFVLALAIALLLGFAGCGGDDEEPSAASTAPPETTATQSAPAETDTAPTVESTVTEVAPEATAPEDQPGGAGDEEPARTLALFTAENGRIAPRVVRVPAFISIQVELRSKDGREYGLRFGDVTISAGGGLNSTATTIDGLRPGKAVVGTPTGAGNRVRIEATAEPGP
jgi:predicted small lipoprotein YifL